MLEKRISSPSKQKLDITVFLLLNDQFQQLVLPFEYKTIYTLNMKRKIEIENYLQFIIYQTKHSFYIARNKMFSVVVLQ